MWKIVIDRKCFADFGDGLTYNVRADEPVNVSETSETELDQAFTKTPSTGSEAESTQVRPKEAAEAKKQRDKAVAKDVAAAAAAVSSPASGSKPPSAASTKKATAVDKLRSQLGAARCRGLPVQVGSGKGSAAMVHDFLRNCLLYTSDAADE